MTDIVERLRAFEDWIRRPGDQKEFNLTTDLFDDAADEIERLRAGGCARDQGTTQYCAEAAKLAAENERLRAALERLVKRCEDDFNGGRKLRRADVVKTRAALDGQPAPGKEDV